MLDVRSGAEAVSVAPDPLAILADRLDPPQRHHHRTDRPDHFAADLSDGRWWLAPHLSYIAEQVVWAVTTGSGGGGVLIVEAPPRHGKSELISHWTPTWFLDRYPRKRVMTCTYEAEFAAMWGRRVRDTVEDNTKRLRVRISRSKRAAEDWTTTEGGGMFTAGVGGSITGRGADLIVVDDPVKNREEAESPAMRQRAWEWWTNVLWTRREPGCSVVLVMTRWHEDDVAGRLIAEARKGGAPVRLIRFPAIAEAPRLPGTLGDDDDGVPTDVLGRAPGEALWPDRYPVGDLEAIERTLGAYAWSALYQQDPVPRSGGAFWSQEVLDAMRQAAPVRIPDFAELAVAVDPSATADGHRDECGIVVGGRGGHADRRVGIVADYSGRYSPEGWGERAILAFVSHRADRIVVEKNNGGDMCASVLRSAAKELLRSGRISPEQYATVTIKPVNARRGKHLRAEPVSQVCALGQVWHHSVFPKLDKQMISWTPATRDSPDRLDAYVHLVTDLLVDETAQFGFNPDTHVYEGDFEL